MKIDFTKISVPKNVAKTEVQVMDLKEAFADAIYNNGPGVAAANLALKIYNSDESTGYDKNEVDLMKGIAKSVLKAAAMDGVLAAIEKAEKGGSNG